MTGLLRLIRQALHERRELARAKADLYPTDNPTPPF